MKDNYILIKHNLNKFNKLMNFYCDFRFFLMGWVKENRNYAFYVNSKYTWTYLNVILFEKSSQYRGRTFCQLHIHSNFLRITLNFNVHV